MAKNAEQADYPAKNNARYIEFLMAITPTEPLNPTDVEEMKRRFKHYLETCALFDMKVGNLNAYLAIGITRQTAYDWVYNRKSFNPERQAFIKQVQDICAGYREALMQDGKVNPVTGIFWQKNFDGLKDTQEIVTTTAPVLGELPDMEKLQKKYLDNAHCTELPAAPLTQKATEGAEKPRRGRKAQKGQSTTTE